MCVCVCVCVRVQTVRSQDLGLIFRCCEHTSRWRGAYARAHAHTHTHTHTGGGGESDTGDGGRQRAPRDCPTRAGRCQARGFRGTAAGGLPAHLHKCMHACTHTCRHAAVRHTAAAGGGAECACMHACLHMYSCTQQVAAEVEQVQADGASRARAADLESEQLGLEIQGLQAKVRVLLSAAVYSVLFMTACRRSWHGCVHLSARLRNCVKARAHAHALTHIDANTPTPSCIHTYGRCP